MSLKVELLSFTPEGERIIASAAKLCYSPSSVEDIMDSQSREDIEKFIEKLSSIGHESPIEHISYTFAIEGVSRSLTHQLVRHRMASYSQQSQRYVRLNQFEYVVPPEIEKSEEAKAIYIKSMIDAQKSYDSISNILYKKHKKEFLKEGKSESEADKLAEKKSIEDARYVFPNACTSKIVVTMNARSLMNFFRHRCCNRAQWEIRALATHMLKLVREKTPILFKNAGPACVSGPCSEGKMTCGKMEEVRAYFNKLGGE